MSQKREAKKAVMSLMLKVLGIGKGGEQLVELVRKLGSRKASLLLAVEAADGLGDIEHFIAFALKIKELCPELNLVGLIGVYGGNVNACNRVIKFLNKHKALFACVLINNNKVHKAEGKSFMELSESERKRIDEGLAPYVVTFDKLVDIEKDIHCIVQLSLTTTEFADTRLQDWISRKQECDQFPYYIIGEYGASAPSGCNAKFISMGFGPECKGIRMVEQFKGPISLESRKQSFLSISDRPFLKAILMQQELESKNLDEYLRSRVFFPAFLQSAPAIVLFIMIQAQVHKDKLMAGGIGLDFHVPKKHLDTKVLMELLQELGLAAKDVVVIQPDNLADKHEQRIRIFVNYLEDEEDYMKLVYFSGSTVGNSGDDSLTTGLSTSNISFYFNSVHPVKLRIARQFSEKFKVQFPTLSLLFGLCAQDVSYEVSSLQRNRTSLINHVQQKFCYDQSILYEEGISYPKFQKDLIRIYSKNIAEFFKKNSGQLPQEVEALRSYLFDHHNIFSVLPEILQATFKFALEPNASAMVIPVDLKEEDEYEKYLETYMVQDPQYLKKAFKEYVCSDIPSEGWHYDKHKDTFWLRISKAAKYRIHPTPSGWLTQFTIQGQSGFIIQATPQMVADISRSETAKLASVGKSKDGPLVSGEGSASGPDKPKPKHKSKHKHRRG